MKLPFSILPYNVLKKISKYFRGFADLIKVPNLSREYVAMSAVSALSFFVVFLVLFVFLRIFFASWSFLILGMFFLLTILIFFEYLYYPKHEMHHKMFDLERNLIPALRSVVVQLHSGVSLFDAVVGVSGEDYGEVSVLFKKAVKEIETGVDQEKALEIIASESHSLFFRRAMWQIINGLRSGSDITEVLSEVIQTLSEEQLDQIRSYKASLSSLSMFYVVTSIILPSLGLTFVIAFTPFIAASAFKMKLVLWGIFMVFVLLQLVYMGLIKSKRPSLMIE